MGGDKLSLKQQEPRMGEALMHLQDRKHVADVDLQELNGAPGRCGKFAVYFILLQSRRVICRKPG